MSWLEDEGLSPREARLRAACDPSHGEARRLARKALEEGRGPRSLRNWRRAIVAAGALALTLTIGFFLGPALEEGVPRLAATAAEQSPAAVKLANSGNVVTITDSSGQIEALVARGGP